MPIDKDTAPLMKAMIKTTYGPVLERTLIGFIIKDLNEIAGSMTVSDKSRFSVAQKMQLIDEYLHSPVIKKVLLSRLRELSRLRYKIAEEVMKQYNLFLPNDEISFYHDVMAQLLIIYEGRVEECINKGDYDLLIHKFSQAPTH